MTGPQEGETTTPPRGPPRPEEEDKEVEGSDASDDYDGSDYYASDCELQEGWCDC